MKVAHLSDLHVYALQGVPARRFLNKRLTGWLNLRYKRGHVHRTAYVEAIAREIARQRVGHVVVTGDLTNLALESEFELARRLLERELGLPPRDVTIVPGNHDAYTRGALSTGRFAAYFGDWLESDLPDLAVATHGARFPIVKLREQAAFVALSSAVPRAPLVAAGEIGRAQLDALARVLQHREVVDRFVVLAVHHPPVHRWSGAKAYLEGLRDGPALLALLETLPRGLLLHGHLHRRIQRDLTTRGGRVQQVGATSASLHHEEADRMAGFNLYDIADGGAVRAEAHVLLPERGVFRVESVPKHV